MDYSGTTWIDVVDNAVKIGSGFIFTGAFALIRANMKSKSKRKHYLFQEEYKMFRETISSIYKYQEVFEKEDKHLFDWSAELENNKSLLKKAITNILCLELHLSLERMILYEESIKQYCDKLYFLDMGDDGDENLIGRINLNYNELISKINEEFKKGRSVET